MGFLIKGRVMKKDFNARLRGLAPEVIFFSTNAAWFLTAFPERHWIP